MGLAITLLGSSCAPNEPERVVGIDLETIAAVAAEIPSSSGRIRMEHPVPGESGVQTSTSTMSFDGDDVAGTGTLPTAEGDLETELRIVGGEYYLKQRALMRWMVDNVLSDAPELGGSRADDAWGEDYLESTDRWDLMGEPPSFGSDGFSFGDKLQVLVDVLTTAAFEGEGQVSDLGGVKHVRHTATVEGEEAVELLSRALGIEMDEVNAEGSPFFACAAGTAPGDAYLAEHTMVEVTIDSTVAGELVQVDVSVWVDSSEYPDCGLSGLGQPKFRMIADELGEPQDIQAPPADLVDPWVDPVFGTDLPEFPSEEDWKAMSGESTEPPPD